MEFSIMSVAKPFVFVGCARPHPEHGCPARDSNATGRKFNSVGERGPPDGQGPTPVIQVITNSMAPGVTTEEKWRFIHEGPSRFAGRELQIIEEIFASASETNAINRAIGDLLRSFGRLATGSEETVDLVHQQSCLNVTARDLCRDGGNHRFRRRESVNG